METQSLSAALKGRLDVPSLATAARWIRKGWVKAKGGGGPGASYVIDEEALYQIRVLYLMAPYSHWKIMAQFGPILQNRNNDPEYNGWLGVLADGKVVNLKWDAQPGEFVYGVMVVSVINLNRMPETENRTRADLGMIYPGGGKVR